jgi:putative ABC transport system permease protein
MRGVRRWFRLRSVERDVDEEIAFHFAELVRDLERGGYPARAAREEAARQFGDEQHYRRQLVTIDRSVAAQARWTRRWEAVRDTVKYAVRGIIRSPALSIGILLAFGFGIGANATMYETVERMLLRPPPHIEDPDEVRRVLVHRLRDGERTHGATITFTDYRELVDTRGFSEVAAVASEPVTIGHGEAAEPARMVVVTASYWPLLGVRPALGRFFTKDEDRIGGARVVVLSHARWQRDHGGSADVLGQTIDFGSGPYTIVGVTPKGFTGVDLQPVDFFAPLMVREEQAFGHAKWVDGCCYFMLSAVVRLERGAPVEAVEAEATTRHRAAWSDVPFYDAEARVVLAPLLEARGPNAPSEVAVARWLLGVAAVVLLIACLNVANLLLARMLRQRREFSIRLALGISRSRLVAQIMAEAVLLGLLGGGIALLLALWGGTLVQNTLLPNIDWTGGPSAAMLFMVVVISVLAGAISAVFPALQASRGDVGSGLRTTAGGISRSSSRVRAGLTVVQAALSVLLLVGAGLFVRSLNRVQHTDFGLALWEVAHVAPVFVAGTTEAEERTQYLEEAAQRVSRLPGVTEAAVASGTPFLSAYIGPLRADGLDSIPAAPTGGPYAHAVDNAYFRTMGVRLQRGRLFDDRETLISPRVVIINESFAQALWPGENPLGRCLYVESSDAPCSEVIGVVHDARRRSLIEETTFQYYMPIQQQQTSQAANSLLLRIPGDMPTTLAAVQRELLALDARVRFVRSRPVAEFVAGELRQWRLGATMFSVFGMLALLVAGIGLYSVLAFDVAQRVREIGLRAALGASGGSIIKLVMSRAMRITAIGIGAGVLLAIILAPRLRDLLYQTSPHDALTLAGVTAALCVVALAAAWVPAWRASRVDPNVALKAE